MHMLGLIESEWGIIIVLVVVVLVFGGSQLPKLARSLGSAQSEFKKGLSEGRKGEGSDTTPAEADKTAAKDGDGPASASG
ncbi:MAG TPA: twin-arginine translocase TatA/TatE family subunit [Acidimicrobiales bacterium]|nr:twin-arginine translocase TatA/TatE family subunit [Acidimicrobiales bacterium]